MAYSAIDRSQTLIATQAALASQRVDASGTVSFKSAEGKTRLDKLHQSGSARIKLPDPFADHKEAILINTAGGLTGGDKLRWEINLQNDTNALITTQASERIYRSLGDDAKLDTDIHVGANAQLSWLPQETILFDNSRLSRSLTVRLDNAATFFAVEIIIFGRTEMGENISEFQFNDSWRILRNAKLIHAEEMFFNNETVNILAQPFALDNNAALATLFYSGSEELEYFAELIQKHTAGNQDIEFGFSRFRDKIVCRALAKDSYILRKRLLPIIQIFRNNQPMPAIWRS